MRAYARPFAVAPMMDWTDRHCRFFHRQLTRHALLYTEMVHAEAVLRGNRERLIGFSAEERPLALQLGGADPEDVPVEDGEPGQHRLVCEEILPTLV
jgi:tRNA-dihydrouridine synthase A